MIAQKGSASWLAASRLFIMYLATPDCATSNPQFAVVARRVPKRIFDTDPSDQHAQLGVDLRSAFGGARLPSPVAAKSVPMQAHDRAVQNIK